MRQSRPDFGPGSQANVLERIKVFPLRSEAVSTTARAGILYEKSFNLKTISQGDFGHFRENDLIILSKVAKIALRDCF